MKRITAFILIFITALCPLYLFSSTASDSFVVEDSVLLSYTGNSTQVSIPDNVYYIADGAFKDNTAIKSVKLHSGVSVIGNEAFYGCTSLSQVEGGVGVTSVGAYAFYNTPFLSKHPDKIVAIGSVAIGGYPSGTLEFSDNIKSIAPYAFAKNKNINSVVTGENLTEIGEGAFLGCTDLYSVNISDSVSYIGALAFQGTDLLSAELEFLVLGDGILVKYGGKDASVVTPDSVKQIAGGAFYGNSTLESVTVSEGVSYIGIRAFMNCSALSSVSLPQSLLVLEKEAFAKCKSLKNALIPENVALMGESVFYGCTSLDVASFKTNIGVPKGTFYGCTALRCAILNHSITSVGESAFENCAVLSDVSLPDTVTFIGDNAFKGADSVTVSCNESSYAYTTLSAQNVNVLQSGDANVDGKVNIRDATYIQKFVANMVEFTSLETLRAESNYDGKVNIRDATYIQKLLAGLA